MNVFPSLTNPTHVDVRFKNVQSDVYLCVKTDEMGKHTLATKTLSSSTDPEVDFSLYYYTSAEAGETKMVLPVHQATNVCFSMTLEKELQISSLISSSDGNELEGPREDPLKFSQADNRFFYIKKSGEEYALEAMNGVHSKHFLCVKELGDGMFKIDIKENTSEDYPEDILFSIDEL